MLPKKFKVRYTGIFKSDSIIDCVTKDNVVTTTFKNEYTSIVKTFCVKDAIDCINKGIWTIVE